MKTVLPGVIDYERGDELDKTIEKLAHHYKVSKQAMTIRLINLEVIPEII